VWCYKAWHSRKVHFIGPLPQ